MTVLDASPRYDLGSEDAYAVISSLVGRSGGQVKAIEEDPSAAANLAVFSDEIDDLMKRVIAVSSAFIDLEENGGESGACDLVAQAFLLKPLSTADISIQNRGGCRSSIMEVSSIPSIMRHQFSSQSLCLTSKFAFCSLGKLYN